MTKPKPIAHTKPDFGLWSKRVVSWEEKERLYLSVVFSWDLPLAANMATRFRLDMPSARVIAGGPAVKLWGAPWADETPDEPPLDVLALHNSRATLTTRGCPNTCAFCAVPRIEGPLRVLPTWRPAPVICDNNILAAPADHFERVIESALPFGCIDFNQGLDASLFTSWHAQQIARVPHAKVRFAFDSIGEESAAQRAVHLARAAGLKDISIYVLIGFKDSPEDALYRLRQVVSWRCYPCPMRFQPLAVEEKNAYVAPNWTDYELRRMGRYFWKYRFYCKTPYENYRPKHQKSQK